MTELLSSPRVAPPSPATAGILDYLGSAGVLLGDLQGSECFGYRIAHLGAVAVGKEDLSDRIGRVLKRPRLKGLVDALLLFIGDWSSNGPVPRPRSIGPATLKVRSRSSVSGHKPLPLMALRQFLVVIVDGPLYQPR